MSVPVPEPIAELPVYAVDVTVEGRRVAEWQRPASSKTAAEADARDAARESYGPKAVVKARDELVAEPADPSLEQRVRAIEERLTDGS